MSDNFFDDNIRKKLETIQPEYSEAAWKRLRSSLPVPWYISLFRDFGGWIFGGIASVAFLTTFFNNQSIKKENQLLNEKISTIESQSLNTVSLRDTVFVNRQDTVYLTKYLTQTKIKYVTVDGNREVDFEQNQVADFQGNKTAKETSKKSLNSTRSVDKNTETQNNVISGKTAYDNLDVKIPLAIPESIKNETSVAENQVLPKMVLPPAEENTLKEPKKMENDNSVPLLDELTVADNKRPKEEKKGSKLSDFLKNLNPRFGVTADYMGRSANSMGPVVEFFLGERFSLGTGLLITGKNELKFGLPRDFNMDTGKKFEDRYGQFFGERPVKIEDIKIETQSIKLPLYFNYYVPFKYNLDFVLTTGTKLNLSTIENVSYMGSNNYGNNYIERFENEYKPRVFNNLLYGMGIQYRKSRFAGQLIPYFEFPFSQGNALSPPKKFGINASLRFSLKK